MNLGDKMRFSATLHRVIVRGEQGNDRCQWKRLECTPQSGILVGVRTISDGERWWENDEIGYVYEPKSYRKAAIVAFALNRKPAWVPMDALEVVS